MATLWPKLAAGLVIFEPPPDPITMTSYCFMFIFFKYTLFFYPSVLELLVGDLG